MSFKLNSELPGRRGKKEKLGNKEPFPKGSYIFLGTVCQITFLMRKFIFVKDFMAHDPGILLLGIYSRDTLKYIPRMFIAVTFVIAKSWK